MLKSYDQDLGRFKVIQG